MPICRTCRGEYDQQEALCPKCEVPVGRNMERCDRCETDTSERRLCPRCKSDVSAWERQDVNFVDFVIWEGGILGFLPGTTALFMWLFFWMPRVESTYYLPDVDAGDFSVLFRRGLRLVRQASLLVGVLVGVASLSCHDRCRSFQRYYFPG